MHVVVFGSICDHLVSYWFVFGSLLFGLVSVLMDSTPNFEKFLEKFACAHINDGFLEDDGWNMMSSFLQSEGSPILKIKALKDRGNNLFNEKCFGAVGACYGEACKPLGLVVGMEGSYDTKSMSDLAVSLNLNLAACALKLFEYEAAKDICSMILSSFPHNVKALFRRGSALMKLNNFLDAQSDFEEALLVEPKNKDILRELCVVKNRLTINSNGKRIMDDHSVQVETGKGKRHVQDDGDVWNASEPGCCSESDSCFESTSVQDSNTSYYGGGSITQSLVCEKHDMELDTSTLVLDQQSSIKSVSSPLSEISCNFDGCANVDNIVSNPDLTLKLEDTLGTGKALLHFSKRGGGHSVLKIDARTYKRLLKGKEVSFFHNSQVSSMRVRILQQTITEPEIGFGTPYKKKKERRSRKKCSRADTQSDNSDDNERPVSSVDIIKTTNCELPVENVTPRFSCEVVSQNALCDSMDSTHHLPYFVFTSTKRTKRQSSKIQSQRDESPRRNVYFYLGKFPRSRDMSVSCYRYFHKAHLPKKRKGMTSSRCYSKSSLKKPRLLSTPSSSLSFCNNNVVFAFDSESQM